MGLLGRVVYGLFHHEPLGLKEKIRWRAPADFSPHDMKCCAAQGNAQRIFCSGEGASALHDWRIMGGVCLLAFPMWRLAVSAGRNFFRKACCPPFARSIASHSLRPSSPPGSS